MPRQRKVQPPALAAAVRVLVIDNEQPILEGMELLLSGWGNIVHTATGLEEALAELAKADGKIDMILADYHLNNEDGISVIRALRTRARRPIPAVLITADRTPAVADLAVAHDVHLLQEAGEAGGAQGGDVACGDPGGGGGLGHLTTLRGHDPRILRCRPKRIAGSSPAKVKGAVVTALN